MPVVQIYKQTTMMLTVSDTGMFLLLQFLSGPPLPSFQLLMLNDDDKNYRATRFIRVRVKVPLNPSPFTTRWFVATGQVATLGLCVELELELRWSLSSDGHRVSYIPFKVPKPAYLLGTPEKNQVLDTHYHQQINHFGSFRDDKNITNKLHFSYRQENIT